MTHKRILIVEDEIIVSTSLTLLLNQNDYDCKVADTGESAIEIFQHFLPDVILMDIGLAGKIDGITTAGIIKKTSNTPIVFITDQNNPFVFQQAKQTSPHQFITKPYTDDTVLHAIELALLQNSVAPSSPTYPLFGERVADGVFIYQSGRYVKVLFNNILYLEAKGMYTNIYCKENIYTIALSSNHVVEQLGYPGIVKTSRSYYVNIHLIESIKNDEVIFGKKGIPLSKNFKEDLLSRIKKISQSNE